MNHSGYSRSYFNLLLIYCATCVHVNTTFTNIKTVVIVQKIDLIQKYWVDFPNFQIKTFFWFFLSPKNLNLTSLKLYMQLLLVGACAVCANGCCYVSWEINHFVKSFWVVNIKNAGFLKLDSFEARVLFRFFLVTQCSLSLPDLSRKIEGPLLTGYKLININFFKDRSF